MPTSRTRGDQELKDPQNTSWQAKALPDVDIGAVGEGVPWLIGRAPIRYISKVATPSDLGTVITIEILKGGAPERAPKLNPAGLLSAFRFGTRNLDALAGGTWARNPLLQGAQDSSSPLPNESSHFPKVT